MDAGEPHSLTLLVRWVYGGGPGLSGATPRGVIMAAVAASMNRGASRRLTPQQEAAQAKQRHGRAVDLQKVMTNDRALVRLDWFKQGLLDRDVIALATALAGNQCVQQLYLWCGPSTCWRSRAC